MLLHKKPNAILNPQASSRCFAHAAPASYVATIAATYARTETLLGDWRYAAA
jgi:hypothetical protein